MKTLAPKQPAATATWRSRTTTFAGFVLKHITALRQTPATLTVLLLIWAIGIATSSVINGPGVQTLRRVGASVPTTLDGGRLYTLITAGLFDANLSSYLLGTAVIAVVGSVVERRWGSRRLIWVALLSQASGLLLSLLLIKVGASMNNNWLMSMTHTRAVGSSWAVVGVLLAYSATADALWRKRIRLGVLATLGTMVLYSGQLTDVLRLGAALAGLLIGVLVIKHQPYPKALRTSRRETRSLVAVLVAASAAGPVLAAVSSKAAGPLAVLRYLFTSPQIRPDGLDDFCSVPSAAAQCLKLTRELRFHGLGPAVLSLLPALLMLVFAWGLKKGRRFAWYGTVVVHILLAGLGLFVLITDVVRRQDAGPHRFSFLSGHSMFGHIMAFALPVAVLTVVLGTRRAFTVPAPIGTYRTLGKRLGLAVAALFVLYVGPGYLAASSFNPSPSFTQIVLDFPNRLAPPGYLGLVSLDFVPTTAISTFLFEWIGIAAWSIAIVLVLRSFTRASLAVVDADAAQARSILEQYGEAALAYLTMWEGNTYWFNDSRTTFVAFRVHGGVAITTGDAIGPASEIPEAMRAFAEYCTGRGWIVCFYSTTAPSRDIGESLGWDSIQVAEETVLPLGELAFTGKKYQDIRTASSRAVKEDIRAEWITFPHAPWAITEQIAAISEEWVATKGLPEMGFTLGGLDELDDSAVRCLIAIDDQGIVHGITSWLPAYRHGVIIGWTLDYMRRRTTAFKGVMEFLISTAALQFQTEGAEFVSLSGAPLARADKETEPSRLQKLLDTLGNSLEPVYGFRSLLHFKAKFQPDYRPIYMLYPETAALPRIGNAISKAYLPHMTMRETVRMLRKLSS
ncbi:rhomboid family intramembrane serine protease [Nakamurella antarctica]|uniref:Rhomboid family intramembrane serine protease n=1 Tax=Nakamurella antarctica TaxID=1902245 RepID=A0A3G8ZY14_9ACTN|nr:DUF2156 domain-containing protein [Nakamurella antarctica]AZI58906.1 rhomboid family intramembrane serine protease [Nakamurella antarctica]